MQKLSNPHAKFPLKMLLEGEGPLAGELIETTLRIKMSGEGLTDISIKVAAIQFPDFCQECPVRNNCHSNVETFIQQSIQKIEEQLQK